MGTAAVFSAHLRGKWVPCALTLVPGSSNCSAISRPLLHGQVLSSFLVYHFLFVQTSAMFAL